MNTKHIVRASRKLSLVLRHKPQAIGLTLDSNGWATVTDLLERLSVSGLPITRAELDTIVAENDKKRFAFNDDGTKIRASQGHSIAVDLELEAQTPPDQLYHGTATRFVASIMRTGLEARSRQHVHLSDNLTTANKVGARHGKPAILIIAAGRMHTAGFTFYRSANGVWLTENVPVDFISRNDKE